MPRLLCIVAAVHTFQIGSGRRYFPHLIRAGFTAGGGKVIGCNGLPAALQNFSLCLIHGCTRPGILTAVLIDLISHTVIHLGAQVS